MKTTAITLTIISATESMGQIGTPAVILRIIVRVKIGAIPRVAGNVAHKVVTKARAMAMAKVGVGIGLALAVAAQEQPAVQTVLPSNEMGAAVRADQESGQVVGVTAMPVVPTLILPKLILGY